MDNASNAMAKQLQKYHDAHSELANENARLRAALEPFAACVFDDNGDVIVSDSWRITPAQWNAARKAITP